MSFRDRIAYKNAIKRAAETAAMIYKNVLPETPYRKCKIKYIVFNPRSRDDDANYETLKPLRDSAVNILKIIEDDKRKMIISLKEKEILSKDYKIILSVSEVKNY